MLGNDLGTDIILIAITGALLFVVGAPARLFALLGTFAISGVVFLSVASPHRLDRFQSWLHPSADTLGSGYQAIQGRFALGSGGWWGLGLGAGREKWGWLPEAHTDFIFAVIGEELGLIGTLAVLVLFALVVYAGIRIALRSHDLFVRLAAGGCHRVDHRAGAGEHRRGARPAADRRGAAAARVVRGIGAAAHPGGARDAARVRP
jgi:cell division protein FtsW